MYKTILSLLLALSLVSCRRSYHIDGVSSLSGLDGCMLYLKVPAALSWNVVDSCEVLHGKFSMTGTADSAMFAILYIGKESILPLVLERGDIHIDINDMLAVASGTPLNDSLYSYVRKQAQLNGILEEMEHDENRMILEGARHDDVMAYTTAKRDSLLAGMDSLTYQFVYDNFDNVLGPNVFLMLCSSLPSPMITPQIEHILNTASQRFLDNPFVAQYVSAIEYGEK